MNEEMQSRSLIFCTGGGGVYAYRDDYFDEPIQSGPIDAPPIVNGGSSLAATDRRINAVGSIWMVR